MLTRMFCSIRTARCLSRIPQVLFALALLQIGESESALAQPEPRLEYLTPDHEHDRWDTRPKDITRGFRAYTTSFDGLDDNDGDGQSDVWGVPEWVSYELRRGSDRAPFEDRPSTWHTDGELYWQDIAPRDQSYVNSGYDRGHMCMRNHARRLGRNADWNTHSVLNAVPQVHEFNDGHWVAMEKLCARWADLYDKVWVICGPVMHTSTGRRRPYGWIGENDELQVAIPHSLFKIVVRESDNPNRPEVLAFIYKNDASLNDKSRNADHSPFLVPVREIEELTGLNFFASLSRADQNAIEEFAAEDVWPSARFGGIVPKDLDDSDEIDRLYDEDSGSERPPASAQPQIDLAAFKCGACSHRCCQPYRSLRLPCGAVKTNCIFKRIFARRR